MSSNKVIETIIELNNKSTLIEDKITKEKGKRFYISSVKVNILDEEVEETIGDNGEYLYKTTLKGIDSLKRAFIGSTKEVDILKRIVSFEKTESNNEQNSPEWIAERLERFTSTQSPISQRTGNDTVTKYILAKNMFVRRVKEEFGEEISSSISHEIKSRDSMSAFDCMRKGSELEAQTFEKLVGMGYNPKKTNLVYWDEFNMVSSSVDAIGHFNEDTVIEGYLFKNGEQFPIEIKNPKFENYLNYAEYSKKFWVQCQTHMIAHGMSKCAIVVDFPLLSPKIKVVELDLKYAEKYLLSVAKQEEQIINLVDDLLMDFSINNNTGEDF